MKVMKNTCCKDRRKQSVRKSAQYLIQWKKLTKQNYFQQINGEESSKVFLKPGEEPKAEFTFEKAIGQLRVREYCNLHGLWEIAV